MLSQESQRSEHSHDSQRLDEAEVDGAEYNWDCGWDNDHEIKNVPCIPNVGFLTTEGESFSENVGHHFTNEEASHHVIDVSQKDSLLTEGVIKRSLQGKTHSWDTNQQDDEVTEVFVAGYLVASHAVVVCRSKAEERVSVEYW